MEGFADAWFVLLDVISVPVGIAMIAAPDWFYALVSKKGTMEKPKNWGVWSRVLGVFFLLMGGCSLWWRFFA